MGVWGPQRVKTGPGPRVGPGQDVHAGGAWRRAGSGGCGGGGRGRGRGIRKTTLICSLGPGISVRGSEEAPGILRPWSPTLAANLCTLTSLAFGHRLCHPGPLVPRGLAGPPGSCGAGDPEWVQLVRLRSSELRPALMACVTSEVVTSASPAHTARQIPGEVLSPPGTQTARGGVDLVESLSEGRVCGHLGGAPGQGPQAAGSLP